MKTMNAKQYSEAVRAEMGDMKPKGNGDYDTNDKLNDWRE